MKDVKDLETLADTETSDVAGIVPEIWSNLVEECAKPKRVMRPLIRLNTDLLNKKGDKVHIPRRETLTCTSVTEGGTVVPSTLTYATAVTLTPSEYGVGVAISRQAVERANINLKVDATEELADAVAQKEDVDIITALTAATANIVYGGDATGTADIATGDVLTPELIAKAQLQIRQDNFEPNVLVVSPEQHYVLGTSEQFTDASKWGGSDLIKTGQIPTYLGVKIYTSTNITAGTAGEGTDIPYHVAIMMEGKKAAAIAVKRNPTIDVEYKTLERKYNIVATMDRDQDLVNEDAVCLIYTADI